MVSSLSFGKQIQVFISRVIPLHYMLDAFVWQDSRTLMPAQAGQRYRQISNI